MRSRPDLRPLLGLLLALAAGPCAAAPSTAPKPAASPAPTTPAALPDYGGRDAPVVPTDAAGTATPNPAAQAGRALEALVIVLAGVVGVVSLLKRAGVGSQSSAVAGGRLLKPFLAGQARAPVPAGAGQALTVVQSQTLPGGATVHLLSVNDKALLLVGATPQNVTLLAEWDPEAVTPSVAEARAEETAFADYLTRVGVAPETGPARAAEGRVAATADRLQDLLARSRGRTPEETL